MLRASASAKVRVPAARSAAQIEMVSARQTLRIIFDPRVIAADAVLNTNTRNAGDSSAACRQRITSCANGWRILARNLLPRASRLAWPQQTLGPCKPKIGRAHV